MNCRGLSEDLSSWSSSLILLSHFTSLCPSGLPFFSIYTLANIDTCRQVATNNNKRLTLFKIKLALFFET